MEQVKQQFGIQNPYYRLIRALIAGLGVVVALGHVPFMGGQPAPDAAFELVGIFVAFLSGLITSERRVK